MLFAKPTLSPEEYASLSPQERKEYNRELRERRNNTYRLDEHEGGTIIPSALPDDSGANYGYKPHEPIPMTFYYAGRQASLDLLGNLDKSPGGPPIFDKLAEYFSAKLPDQTPEHTWRDRPTEYELLTKKKTNVKKESRMTSPAMQTTGRQRMVMVTDEQGKPLLSFTASCVFYSDNSQWLVTGAPHTLNLDKLKIGQTYNMVVANPNDNSTNVVSVVNFDITMPNPIGGGAYGIFGISKEITDDGEDGDASGEGPGEEVVDNATFL